MKNQIKERRNTVDIWIYAVRALATIGWVLFIFALIISSYAAPEINYGVLRYHSIEIRKFWLTPLTGYLYIILWLSALSTFICLVIDRYRSRRKSDGSYFNTLLLLIITVVWVSFIFVQISEVNV